MNNGMKRLAIDTTIALSLISIAGIGGLAWGQIKEKVKTNSENILQLEEGEEQRIEILLQQESLSVRLEGMQREQKEFRNDLKGQLNRILRKLDSSNRSWRSPQ